MADKSIEELEKIGDAEAFCEIGLRYYYGKEVEKNYEKAFEYFKKSMEMGSARGKYNVMLSYYYGEGVDENVEMTYELIQELKENNFEGLTEKNVIIIKRTEAKMFYYGDFVNRNYKKSFEIFKELVDKYNDKYSMGYLVALYFYGNGVEKDYEKAKAYAEILEKDGDLYSRAILGDMYYFGKGVDVNYSLAKNYYEKSLDERYDATYYRLGKIYKEGLECERNEEKAEKYFNKIEKDIFRVTIYAMLALNEEKDCSFDIILQYAEMDFKFFIDWIEAFPDKHPCRLYLKKLKSLKDTEYRDIADMFMKRIKKYSKENKIRGNFEDEDDVEEYISDIIN